MPSKNKTEEVSRKKASRCRGESTSEITQVVGYGNKRQSAYDNMISIVAYAGGAGECSGDCTGDDECLPVTYLNEENVDCRPYRTKSGEVKWRCKYSGEARYVCECLPG